MVVDKNILLSRDKDGNLLPIEVESTLFKGTLKVLPITKGDLNSMTSSGQGDADIICKFIVDPPMTKEDVEKIPIMNQRELIKLVLKGGGLTDDEIRIAQEQNLRALEQELKKK